MLKAPYPSAIMVAPFLNGRCAVTECGHYQEREKE